MYKPANDFSLTIFRIVHENTAINIRYMFATKVFELPLTYYLNFSVTPLLDTDCFKYMMKQISAVAVDHTIWFGGYGFILHA